MKKDQKNANIAAIIVMTGFFILMPLAIILDGGM